MPRLNFPNIEKHTIYILPFLILLATDDLFKPYEYGTPTAYGGLLQIIVKLAGLAAVVFTIMNIKKLHSFELLVAFLAFVYLTVLVFESIFLYNDFMRYPHVLLKLLNLFVVLALFAFYKGRDSVNFSVVMNFIILGLLMKIAIQPSMLSLQAFVSHDRGLPAESVFLLTLPCIYFFNQYLTSLKTASLMKFLFLLLFILIANHRSVWVTIAFSLLINLFMIRKNVQFRLGKVLQSLMLVGIIFTYILSLVISYSPSVEEKVTTNITNILNPTEDDTGSWRVLQMQSYWPVVQKNFLSGLRWQGFELPIQFYHPEAGITYFEDGTGHHFHSFYLDILFYFGIVGLILFILIMAYPAYIVIRQKLVLNNLQLSFFIFSLSGLVYGIAYNLPFSYWLIFGIALVHVEMAYQTKNKTSTIIEMEKSNSFNL